MTDYKPRHMRPEPHVPDVPEFVAAVLDKVIPVVQAAVQDEVRRLAHQAVREAIEYQTRLAPHGGAR